ncbi:MAG: CYTH domain-containing protein [Gammaproteobacteria bacterium]|nr:MAG: CYTH domain-containing protein [Gammaproteobacteria bacterium]
MGVEIERKFLVKDDTWKAHSIHQEEIAQGYLANTDKCSVRIRLSGESAFLNIKSMTLGVWRQEYDYDIPTEDARSLLKSLCQKPVIEKTRYHVPWKGHVWEIDVFHGANQGLVLAEVELQAEDEAFALPPWIGKEVTHLERYYNVTLVQHSFDQWNPSEQAGEG